MTEEEIERLEEQNEELRKDICDLRKKRDALNASLPTATTGNFNATMGTGNANIAFGYNATSNLYTGNIYCPYIPLSST